MEPTEISEEKKQDLREKAKITHTLEARIQENIKSIP